MRKKLCIQIPAFKSYYDGKNDFQIKISRVVSSEFMYTIINKDYNHYMNCIASDNDIRTFPKQKNEGNIAKPPSLAVFEHLTRRL